MTAQDVAAVQGRHFECKEPVYRQQIKGACASCLQWWPCDAALLLDELTTIRDEVERCREALERSVLALKWLADTHPEVYTIIPIAYEDLQDALTPDAERRT